MSFALRNYDALVLIHPDYSVEMCTPQYVTAVVAAINRASEIGMPVFYAFGDLDETTCTAIRSQLDARRALQLPNCGSGAFRVKLRWRRRRAQREVDQIAQIVGKPPQRISLAFGGMYRDA